MLTFEELKNLAGGSGLTTARVPEFRNTFGTNVLSLEQWVKIIIVSASLPVVGFFLKDCISLPCCQEKQLNYLTAD